MKFVRAYRVNDVIYKKLKAILNNMVKEWNNEYHLNKKKYYNLISFIIRNKENILIDFFIALNNPNFIVKVRYLYVKDMYKRIIKRIFEQIVLIDNF